MKKEAVFFTETRVLGTAACHGSFTVSKHLSIEEERAKTVLELVGKGYLQRGNIYGDNVEYNITQSGKEYLKSLIAPNDSPPKHTPDPEKMDKTQELELIVGKRFNILKNANKRGLDFNLTDSNVRALLRKKTCHYTGVVFESDEDPLNVRTFERIDDTLGYVQGNVVAVTLRANRIKNLLLESYDSELKITTEQFIKMADRLRKYSEI